jgi:hypothetical protein
MSLYSITRAVNPFADDILKMIGLERDKVPRFRDVFAFCDPYQVVILTRAGGGNRKHNKNGIAYLRNNKYYVRDKNSNFDKTFAEFYYIIPEKIVEELRKFCDQPIEEPENV